MSCCDTLYRAAHSTHRTKGILSFQHDLCPERFERAVIIATEDVQRLGKQDDNSPPISVAMVTNVYIQAAAMFLLMTPMGCRDKASYLTDIGKH